MDMTHYSWDDLANNQRVKYESNGNDDPNRLKDDRSLYACCDGNLNFQTAPCSEDDCEYGGFKKNKVPRQDPMSHRIIEKRRRDRMNNCLADLSRLIPTEYLKKGRGRIEKTEIIEMAIKHMKYLQQEQSNPTEHYRLGYQECMSETMRFMVEVEGHFPRDAICVRLLSHLTKHCELISRAPHIPQQTPSPTHVPVHHPQELTRNVSVPQDYQVPKQESESPEQNNNNGCVTNSCNNSESEHEKHHETNGALYKYKTNIKLRFNQDLNGGQEVPTKKPKLESSRRNSVTSLENHSSSHSSPPSSEVCTRISDGETVHRRSPTDSTASATNMRIEQPHRIDVIQRYSPTIKSPPQNNFSVPIFALHSKGSYYVPLTVDYKALVPYLQNFNVLDVGGPVHNVVLHPVTISVNFQPNYDGKYKMEWH
ncbi:transcription factor cwo [Aethina tumida]|uniref:transcription factor cwo n=1 Tax=Aethina tumida TaxID=116153 RepID=UPI00096B65C4|nr:transcription factor cwo [Aethina tumida]